MPRSTSRKSDKPYKAQANIDILFGDGQESPTDSMSVKLEAMVVPQQQIRRYFDPEKMAQLTASVKEHGILENLLVRPIRNRNGAYELVAGERRYRAALEAGLTEVPVTVKELSDSQALAISLIENLQREDLNPVEETEGILLLLSSRLKLPVEEVSSLLYRMHNQTTGKVTNNVIGKPEKSVSGIFTELGLMSWESFVSNRLPLLKLPEEVLEALRKGKIAYTKAKALSKVADGEARKKLLDEAIKSSLSLSQIRERVAAIAPKEEKEDLRSRLDNTYKRVRKVKNLWQDPKKRRKLQSLLAQLEKLIEAE
ncbi:MAG: ParB/RepB/Spo0J family partition protein [Xenococcaceae cyanobacterium]